MTELFTKDTSNSLILLNSVKLGVSSQKCHLTRFIKPVEYEHQMLKLNIDGGAFFCPNLNAFVTFSVSSEVATMTPSWPSWRGT